MQLWDSFCGEAVFLGYCRGNEPQSESGHEKRLWISQLRSAENSFISYDGRVARARIYPQILRMSLKFRKASGRLEFAGRYRKKSLPNVDFFNSEKITGRQKKEEKVMKKYIGEPFAKPLKLTNLKRL